MFHAFEKEVHIDENNIIFILLRCSHFSKAGLRFSEGDSHFWKTGFTFIKIILFSCY